MFTLVSGSLMSVGLGSSDLLDEIDGRNVTYVFIVALNAVFIVGWLIAGALNLADWS